MVNARKPATIDARINSNERIDSIPGGVETLTRRQRDTAQYVADMILELRNMAKSAKLFQVLVPLEYAYYEAFSVAHRVEIPPEELERLRELSKAGEGFDAPAEEY